MPGTTNPARSRSLHATGDTGWVPSHISARGCHLYFHCLRQREENYVGSFLFLHIKEGGGGDLRNYTAALSNFLFAPGRLQGDRQPLQSKVLAAGGHWEKERQCSLGFFKGVVSGSLTMLHWTFIHPKAHGKQIGFDAFKTGVAQNWVVREGEMNLGGVGGSGKYDQNTV